MTREPMFTYGNRYENDRRVTQSGPHAWTVVGDQRTFQVVEWPAGGRFQAIFADDGSPVGGVAICTDFNAVVHALIGPPR